MYGKWKIFYSLLISHTMSFDITIFSAFFPSFYTGCFGARSVFFRLHCSLLLVSSLHHHYFSVIFILLQPLYYIHCVPPIKRKRNENRSFAKRAWQQRGYGNLRQLNSSTRMLHERIGFFSLCFAKKLIRSFTFVLQKCERMREKTNFRYTHSSGAQIHWRRHKMTSEKT